MNYYQSFGGGVNSTALIIRLKKKGLDFESVFVDLGAEDPRTYENIEVLKNEGYEITVLKPSVKSGDKIFDNIYDYYFHQKIVPFIMYRSCTDRFKIQTLNKHYGTPCKVFIGIDYGEKHRRRESKKKGIEFSYPLIDWKVNRRKCIEEIRGEGLKVPPKSGCYICPFQSKESWWALARDNPDLFWRAVALDENSPKVGLLKHLKKGKRQFLRDLYPPPATFEAVDLGCRRCVFGIE